MCGPRREGAGARTHLKLCVSSVFVVVNICVGSCRRLPIPTTSPTSILYCAPTLQLRLRSLCGFSSLCARLLALHCGVSVRRLQHSSYDAHTDLVAQPVGVGPRDDRAERGRAWKRERVLLQARARKHEAQVKEEEAALVDANTHVSAWRAEVVQLQETEQELESNARAASAEHCQNTSRLSLTHVEHKARQEVLLAVYVLVLNMGASKLFLFHAHSICGNIRNENEMFLFLGCV